MPYPTRSLSTRRARDLIAERAFPATTGSRVGVELEWLTRSTGPAVTVDALRRLLEPTEPLPARSAITFEPGGQVEISTRPFGTCAEAIDAAAVDSASVRSTLRAAGIDTIGLGLDPDRSEALVTDAERYVAMRAYFDERGPAGGRMMCTTAAVHVNVDAGSDAEGARRWRLAHTLGPTLVAAFANSPLVYGRPSGWKSARFSAWIDIDPTRTAPVGRDWVRYALAANVMFIRGAETFVPIRTDLPFQRWIKDGHELGFPTEDDLEYHLTTLFPPIRPHGRLELRMFDMLPEPWWRAAVVVATALLNDAEAGAVASEATRETANLWTEAARFGLGHPGLTKSAEVCFTAALNAVGRIGCDDESRRTAEAYYDRFVAHGRSPADDRLDDFKATGLLYPSDETVEETST